MLTNLAAGGVQEGGSTLTQQLVKQTLLQTADTPEERAAADEQTLGRKLREARLALALEDTYSKDELLTRYLNIVYFGQNAYGVQPAARAFFGVDASALTLTQAALLAGLVQSPSDDDPFTDPEGATVRRNQVLTRMAAQGYITPAERDAAIAAPLGLAPGPGPAAGLRRGQRRPLRLRLRAAVPDPEPRPDPGAARPRRPDIQTTLDPELQRSGDAAVLNTLPLEDSRVGDVLRRRAGHRAPARAERQPDLRLRPERSAAGVLQPQRGAEPGGGVDVQGVRRRRRAGAGLLDDRTRRRRRTRTSPGSTRRTAGPYPVENAGRYRATLDLTTALYQSSNTYFVALEDALGSVEEPVRMAEAMGLYQFGPAGLAQQIIDEKRGSFTLGPDATSPLGLASAYSTLAAGGTQCDVTPGDGGPRPARAAADRRRRGRRWSPATTARPEAIPPGVANTLNQMLRKDVEPGNPGQTASRAYVPGHQIAGKTGTTQKQRLRGLRRLHAGDHRQRHGVQPEGEPERRRLRWRQGRDRLARRDGADPRGAGERGLPAGRSRRRQRQHQAGARLLDGEPVPQRAQRGRLPDRDWSRVDSDKKDGELVGHEPAARRAGGPGPARDDPGQQRLRLHRAHARPRRPRRRRPIRTNRTGARSRRSGGPAVPPGRRRHSGATDRVQRTAGLSARRAGGGRRRSRRGR